jgi:hypothetical protein
LLTYGERIIGTLGDVLGDKQGDLAIRREIPWVLSRIPGRRSIDILVENLGTDDGELKFRIVKALNRLHEGRPELPIPTAAVDERIGAEVRNYYEMLSIRKVIASNGDGADKALLSGALHDRLKRQLEVIFRLLGLQHPQKDIYFAYSALKGSSRENRAAAIEFLDNVLEMRLKPAILPLLEESSAEVLVDRARSLYGIQSDSRNEAIRKLLRHSDVWLKACALHEVGDKRILELIQECRTLASDANPLIQETASWAVARCN